MNGQLLVVMEQKKSVCNQLLIKLLVLDVLKKLFVDNNIAESDSDTLVVLSAFTLVRREIFTMYSFSITGYRHSIKIYMFWKAYIASRKQYMQGTVPKILVISVWLIIISNLIKNISYF